MPCTPDVDMARNDMTQTIMGQQPTAGIGTIGSQPLVQNPDPGGYGYAPTPQAMQSKLGGDWFQNMIKMQNQFNASNPSSNLGLGQMPQNGSTALQNMGRAPSMGPMGAGPYSGHMGMDLGPMY